MPELPDDWFERFEQGIAEFNAGQYYDCHETLEHCWNDQGLLDCEMTDPHREFVQGLIQISVGYYHLTRKNVKGAAKLINRGFGRVKNFPLVSYPLDMSEFEAIVQSTVDILAGLPSDGSGPVDLSAVQFPKVARK